MVHQKLYEIAFLVARLRVHFFHSLNNYHDTNLFCSSPSIYNRVLLSDHKNETYNKTGIINAGRITLDKHSVKSLSEALTSAYRLVSEVKYRSSETSYGTTRGTRLLQETSTNTPDYQ